MTKICTKCGIEKDVSEFYVRKDSGYRRPDCRTCVIERNQRWRKENPERARETQAVCIARWRAANPDKWRAQWQRQTERKSKARGVGENHTRECTRCHEPFTYLKTGGGVRRLCDLCRDHRNDWNLFGLTGAQAVAKRSVSHCEICGTDKPGGRFNNWHIDHDHDSGIVRGVLCALCNTGIGMFRDDPELLLRAVEYLRIKESA